MTNPRLQDYLRTYRRRLGLSQAAVAILIMRTSVATVEWNRACTAATLRPVGSKFLEVRAALRDSRRAGGCPQVATVDYALGPLRFNVPTL